MYACMRVQLRKSLLLRTFSLFLRGLPCQVARHPPPSRDTISTALHHLPPREEKAARQNLTDPPSLPCATESSKIQRTSTIPEDLPRGKLPVFPSRLFASTISLRVSSNGGVTKGRPSCSIKEELGELDFDSSTKTSGSFVASRPIHGHRTNSSTSGLSRILRSSPSRRRPDPLP